MIKSVVKIYSQTVIMSQETRLNKPWVNPFSCPEIIAFINNLLNPLCAMYVLCVSLGLAVYY